MKIVRIITSLLIAVFLGSAISFGMDVNPEIAVGATIGANGLFYGISYLSGYSISGLAMATVDITGLQESAIRYDKDLKMLPLAVLKEELGKLGIALLPNIQNKHVRTNFERSGGIMKPYAGGAVINSDLGKAEDVILEVHDAYASVKDNVRNYKSEIVGPDVLLGKNKSKKHPWQKVMLWAIVSTFGEDIGDCLFGGSRNADGLTPKDLFNGFDTLVTTKVSGGTISEDIGNRYATGAITKPSDNTDTDAFDQLFAMWANAHPALRKVKTNMVLPWDVMVAYQMAHFNKYKNKPEFDLFGRTVLPGSGGKCQLVTSPFAGTGDRVVLTVPGNFEFGMDSMNDSQFVQVRNPYEDPNLIQFWIQGSYGVRINTINKKKFIVNDGTPIHTDSFAGDYEAASS